jgi:EamA domain-containing membrane protein RarD
MYGAIVYVELLAALRQVSVLIASAVTMKPCIVVLLICVSSCRYVHDVLSRDTHAGCRRGLADCWMLGAHGRFSIGLLPSILTVPSLYPKS